MDTDILIDASGVYLRQLQRLRKDQPLPDESETQAWDHAVEAAERLERLRAKAPVPVRRRNCGSPGAH